MLTAWHTKIHEMTRHSEFVNYNLMLPFYTIASSNTTMCICAVVGTNLCNGNVKPNWQTVEKTSLFWNIAVYLLTFESNKMNFIFGARFSHRLVCHRQMVDARLLCSIPARLEPVLKCMYGVLVASLKHLHGFRAPALLPVLSAYIILYMFSHIKRLIVSKTLDDYMAYIFYMCKCASSR